MLVHVPQDPAVLSEVFSGACEARSDCTFTSIFSFYGTAVLSTQPTSYMLLVLTAITTHVPLFDYSRPTNSVHRLRCVDYQQFEPHSSRSILRVVFKLSWSGTTGHTGLGLQGGGGWPSVSTGLPML